MLHSSPLLNSLNSLWTNYFDSTRLFIWELINGDCVYGPTYMLTLIWSHSHRLIFSEGNKLYDLIWLTVRPPHWQIYNIIIWTMSDINLFNLKVRKIHVQQTSPWIRSMKIMKIATQKGHVDNKWRQCHQNPVVEAAFNTMLPLEHQFLRKLPNYQL